MMPMPVEAQQYTSRQDGDLVKLEDRKNRTVVSAITSVGNMAYELSVNGQNLLRSTFSSIDDLRAEPTGMHGIVFLGPWANRLDEQAFYANGRRYPLDMQLGNVTGVLPIHGFMSRTDGWQVVETGHDERSAWVTSRLDAHKQPAWMKQWPFEHTIDMTYRLQDGVLEVFTKVTNCAAEPMPISIGYHPFYQLTDSPRDEWTVSVAARTRWLLSDQKVPTGETEPADRLFPNGRGALKGRSLDDVFSDLVRDASGRATVTLRGRRQQLDISQGPNYRSLVVYSPSSQDFICVEPMAGITNALNLGHKGVYKELQYVRSGGTWQESFWITPSGF